MADRRADRNAVLGELLVRVTGDTVGAQAAVRRLSRPDWGRGLQAAAPIAGADRGYRTVVAASVPAFAKCSTNQSPAALLACSKPGPV